VVVGFRTPRTVTTWMWRDGTASMVYKCLAEGAMSMADLKAANEELGPSGGMVVCTGRDTHMFDGALTVSFLQSAGAQHFRRKRAELGVTVKDAKGMLMADAFTGNRDKSFLHQQVAYVVNH